MEFSSNLLGKILLALYKMIGEIVKKIVNINLLESLSLELKKNSKHIINPDKMPRKGALEFP